MPPAARTARTGSSSCERGIPKTAMTASPMNFSTVPPWEWITSSISSKKRPITRRRASGSNRSPSAVEPVTSANRIVTTLRTSEGISSGGNQRRGALLTEPRAIRVLFAA